MFMFLGNDKQLNKISAIGNIEIDKDEIKRVKKTKYLGGQSLLEPAI